MGGENCMTHMAIAGTMLFVEGTEHDSCLRFHTSAIMATIMKLRQCQPSARQISTSWLTRLQGDWLGRTHSVIGDNPFLTYHSEVPQTRHLPLDLVTARHTASHVM